jgi:hypothetical protein
MKTFQKYMVGEIFNQRFVTEIWKQKELKKYFKTHFLECKFCI